MKIFEPKYQLIETDVDAFEKVAKTFVSFVKFQMELLNDYRYVGFMIRERKGNITFYREYSGIPLIDNYKLDNSTKRLPKWFKENINNDDFDTIEIQAFGNGIRLTFGNKETFNNKKSLEEKIEFIKKNSDTVEIINEEFTFLDENGERQKLVGEDLKNMLFKLMQIKK